MLRKLAIIDIKRAPIINMLIIILIFSMFFVVITIVSAIQLKYKKYSTLVPYLTQKGVCIESYNLTRQTEDGVNVFIRDSEELRETLSDVKDVLSVESLWNVSASGIRESVVAWCYSEDVINAMKDISMKEGEWFSDETMESDILNVVLSYNKSDVNVGDIITVSSGIGGASFQAKVIGIVNNGEKFFYQNLWEDSKGDCRDCFYTYDYDREEENIIMIFSDQQILNGQKDGKYKELNYRISPSYGIQKQMQGCTIITYEESVEDSVITSNTNLLRQNSLISKVYNLDEMNHASLNYIFQELKDYFPIFICILLFVLIASVSVNVITVKRQLKNYAIYYLCGLSWEKCSKISMYESVMITGIAFLLVFFSMFVLKISGRLESSALQMGWIQVCIMFGIGVIYIFMTWIIPRLIVNRTTAKQLLASER